MSTEEENEKLPRETVEAFDLYDRIKSTVSEYCDDWIMVGKRCDGENRLIIGTTDKGWGELKPIYDFIQKWKENSISDE